MYKVDQRDKVVELEKIPQSSTGAPIPSVLASGNNLFLVYCLENIPDDWNSSSIRVVGPESVKEHAIIVTFSSPYAHMFGPPNDEAFLGHPLSNRGLKPYGAFEIKNSSWLRELEKLNSVHPEHNKESFIENKKHFIFSFHDSTFECIAESFEYNTQTDSTINIISSLSQKLT